MLNISPPNAGSPDGAHTPLTGASSVAVLIVGMHRSGTSALGGMLNKLGVAVPEDLHPADEHNARGYFEPARIINFHERLLARLGSPSDDPLPLGYDWVRSPVGEAAADELADLLDEEFAGNPMCLFKDPRICRLMPVWSAALARSGRAAVAILPLRHPLEVAGSLAAKANLGRPYSLFMWLQHVILGERFTREMRRSFSAYDELIGDWRTVSARLQRDLGVSWPKDAMRAGSDVDTFLSGELRHHQGGPSEALDPDAPLEALCRRAWATRDRFLQDPYDASAMAEFDAIWADFEAGMGVYGPLVVEYQRIERKLAGDVRRLWSEGQTSAEIIARQAEAIHDQAEVQTAAVQRISELEGAVRGRDRELREGIRNAARNEQELQRAAQRAEQSAQRLRLQLEQVSARLHQIETSTFWALSHPLRRALTAAPGLRIAGRRVLKLAWWTMTFKLGRKLRSRTLATTTMTPSSVSAPTAPATYSATMALPAALPELPAAEKAMSGNILFVSGEATTPGHRYRVVRWAEAAERAGAKATVIPMEQISQHLHDVRFADFVFLWRTAWTPDVEALLNVAKEAGTPVVFDTDDLMFDPAMASSDIIDGIRSQGLDETDVADFYRRVQGVLARADFCTAPTPFLAEQMRRHEKPAFVLPNGFDEDVLRRSRLAARRRRREAQDGLVRIGYATGTRTHQKDFAQCADGVAAVLRGHPATRLVLFTDGENPVLDVTEFPAFAGLESQIEWRQLVPIEELPVELARFDICIAPLEVGNPFCEAKSELKFFEAALVDVPTVASPTEPFRAAIRNGVSGFLAADQQAWRDALTRLVEDPALRRRMAQAALYVALAEFGPERRVEAFLSVSEQVLLSPRRAGRAFELELLRAARPPVDPPHVPPHEIVFEHDRLGMAEVTIVIPLYNYSRYVVEALESIRDQTSAVIDLVVVNDCSTDDSEAVAEAWLKRNVERFNRTVLIRNVRNAGLGFTRNVGFANAETPYILPLDADNRLRPHCLQQAVGAIERSGAAFAYSRIRHFGDSEAEIGYQTWAAARFVGGNYIDAMALIRRSAWAAAGGYDHVRHGWEDFDFWCRLVERGMFAVQVPEILADYRVHANSMLRTETELLQNKLSLVQDMERRHSWLRLARPAGLEVDAETPAETLPSASATPVAFPGPIDGRLTRILPLLRCPRTGKPLVLDGEVLRAEGGDVAWPLVAGRPVLFEGLSEPRVFPDDHISNELPERAIELIEQTPGLVLNLSAGGTAKRYDHVIEAEFAVFRNTDVIADAHALPFADETFDLVVSMNAFEHYHSPRQAADEILRVLKPGGRVLVRTAFLQPLHEAPWHFYNCTRYGLERWFERFETQDMQVSDNFNPVHAITWQLSEAEQLLGRELSAADARRFANASAKELIALWRDPATRGSPLWRRFFDLPQEAQEGLAAGFEFLGRKPS